jgi:hypothetical protein
MSNTSAGEQVPNPEELPARADRDYFPPLAAKIGDVDKTCLGCLAGITAVVLSFLVWGLVWYLRTPEVQQRH